MMNLQEFAEKLLENVTRQVASDEEVKLTTLLTRNAVKNIRLQIQKAGQQIATSFRVKEIYQDYLDGHGKDDLNDLACQLIAEHRNKIEYFKNLEKQLSMYIGDFEQVKSHIYLKIINTEWSRELLSTTPHVPYLDLSAVFYLYNPKWNILIHDNFLDMWNITAEELYEIALDNMIKQQPVEFYPVNQFLENPRMPSSENPYGNKDEFLYMLTNADGQYGAAVLLYPNLLERYAEQYQCDWIVIPSSVHEVLLMPYHSEEMIEKTRTTIQEINCEMLNKEDVLSDHPYLYRKGKKELISV